MKNILLIILLLSLLSCSTSTVPNEIDKVLDEFEWQLQKDLQDDNLNGSISMTIVNGDRIIRSKAFGAADLKKLPADTSTIYRVGSITKTFTAFLMMQLAQDGLLQLDDPIEKYLPEIKQMEGYSDSNKITFRQLASHTGGLYSGPNLGRQSNNGIGDWESELLACIPVTAFKSNPGERYSYSNIGFGILGLAISRAADEPYIELVHNRIFEPLNMTNSFFELPEHKKVHLAQGRWGGPMGGYDDQRPKDEHKGRGWRIPNGGIYSTTNDLAKFMICNMGYSELMDEDNLTLMQSVQTSPGKWYENYGLGLSIYKDSLIHTIGHQGGTPGYRANFLFEKESEYGVILLRNYSSGITDLNLRSTVLLRKLKGGE